MPLTRYEGSYTAAADGRFVIVAARFNEFVVERLLDGALDCLRRHAVPDDRIVLVRTPGAFELPNVCKRMALAPETVAVLALGCVIRGATPHFDYVCSSAASGCAQVALESGKPVIFGVLTTDTIEQAIERAGTKSGNKGADAALAALEMVQLHRALSGAGY